MISLNDYGDLECTCGNNTHSDGFVTVDSAYVECEPDVDGPWEGLWSCLTCGAIKE